jgi:hypothetical protein
VLDEVNVAWKNHLTTWGRHFGPGRFIAAEFAVLVGTICCFAKVQNDTWWHLAAGRSMAETGRVTLTEEFSHTAYGVYWANYEWLSEVVSTSSTRLVDAASGRSVRAVVDGACLSCGR